jgi:hypothetical protein
LATASFDSSGALAEHLRKEGSFLREIAWLQVSDIHMRQRDAWSQDVVLRAMADSIRNRCTQGLTLDFILATGDLAYSGKDEEYKLVGDFLDELVSATGVPKERIFCIPGNHDVNRERQKLCFQGARSALTSPNTVDLVLAPDNDDLATLIQRQEAYRAFQTSYFGPQARAVTSDNLAFVYSLTIDDVVIAVVGLNSAWLAEGGLVDHGNLLIGERQVINALDAVDKFNPHIIIGMAHHPLHLLREFDRNAVTRRVHDSCDFFHCGHLHQPEAYGAGFDASACLTVAAGASFETRESQNSYALVKLDLLAGTRTLTTVRYDPGQGVFEFSSEKPFPIRLVPASTCSVDELAKAISAFDPTQERHSYYLAALLLQHKSEVPIPGQGSYVFAALAVLQRQPGADDLCDKTVAFLRFQNVLTVLYGRRPLADLLTQHGQGVKVYGAELHARCRSDVALATRLAQQNTDVRNLLAAQPEVSFAVDLFAELVAAQDWPLLREQATRHLDNPDDATRVRARRMLALALAHSIEVADMNDSVRVYEGLIRDNHADARDRGNLALLLMDLERTDEAKAAVLDAVVVCRREALNHIAAAGQQIVGRTGDREFRKQLEAAIAQRGGHD